MENSLIECLELFINNDEEELDIKNDFVCVFQREKELNVNFEFNGIQTMMITNKIMVFVLSREKEKKMNKSFSIKSSKTWHKLFHEVNFFLLFTSNFHALKNVFQVEFLQEKTNFSFNSSYTLIYFSVKTYTHSYYLTFHSMSQKLFNISYKFFG